MNEKELWNKLASENYKYYIYSDKGKGVTDSQFNMSGESDYQNLICNDEIIYKKYPIKNDVNILEVGCGAGRLLVQMAKDFRDVFGIDISDAMISLAKQRTKYYKNIFLDVTDGSNIPYSDNTIDLVFSYAVFQHIKDYSKIENNFGNIHRVLVRGGIFKVLLGRTKYKNYNNWWSGIEFTEEMIENLSNKYKFNLLKKEYTDDNRVWLWLEKP